MTDNKIGPHIPPVGEPRATPKPAHKPPAGGQDFSKTLEQVQTGLDKINQEMAGTPAAGDARALRAAYEAERERFEIAMREAERLRQLHQNITQKQSRDER